MVRSVLSRWRPAALLLAAACDRGGPPVRRVTAAQEAAARIHAESTTAMARRIGMRLDRVPIVVYALGTAEASYRTLLGFTIKPGRDHGNGLTNAHITFADGTSLELLEAGEPRDDLAQFYRDALNQGEHGALVSLEVPLGVVRPAMLAHDSQVVTRDFGPFSTVSFPPGSTLQWLSFIQYHERPSDAGFTRHLNGASRLRAVWISGDGVRDDLAFLERLGIDRTMLDTVRVGDGRQGIVLRLARGEIYWIPRRLNEANRGTIIGVTVEVPNVTTIRTGMLARMRARDFFPLRQTSRGLTLTIQPGLSHGLLIEFLETKAVAPR